MYVEGKPGIYREVVSEGVNKAKYTIAISEIELLDSLKARKESASVAQATT